MISFKKFLNEIAVDSDLLDSLSSKKGYSGRSYSKLAPTTKSFRNIEIKLSYAVYNVFKRYVSPKFKLAGELLDRRGDSVAIVDVKASNEELFNLKELAEYIIHNAPEYSATRPDYTNQEREIAVAKLLLKDIDEIFGQKA